MGEWISDHGVWRGQNGATIAPLKLTPEDLKPSGGAIAKVEGRQDMPNQDDSRPHASRDAKESGVGMDSQNIGAPSIPVQGGSVTGAQVNLMIQDALGTLKAELAVMLKSALTPPEPPQKKMGRPKGSKNKRPEAPPA